MRTLVKKQARGIEQSKQCCLRRCSDVKCAYFKGVVVLLNSSILRATRILGSLVSVVVAVSAQQQLTNFDRSRVQGMLQVLADDVRKHYYAPKFHGVDWDA